MSTKLEVKEKELYELHMSIIKRRGMLINRLNASLERVSEESDFQILLEEEINFLSTLVPNEFRVGSIVIYTIMEGDDIVGFTVGLIDSINYAYGTCTLIGVKDKIDFQDIRIFNEESLVKLSKELSK